MTALMIEKPDDHIAFIRECLDKVPSFSLFDIVDRVYFQAQQNPNRIRWELFVSNSNSSKSVLPSKPSVARNRSRVLPPVRNLTTTTKPNPLTAIKPPALPPIEDHKKSADNVPIIFVLSKSSSSAQRQHRCCSLSRFNRCDEALFKTLGTLRWTPILVDQ